MIVDAGNLIPASRLAAARRATVVRRCVAAVAAYAIVLFVGCTSVRVYYANAASASSHELETIADRAKRATAAVALSQSKLTAAKRSVAAAHELAAQPDWSKLLVIVATCAGSDVSFMSCSLSAKDSTVASQVSRPATRPASPKLLLTLQGTASSQAHVASLAAELEKTGLFTHVETTNSQRGASNDAITFRVECTLEAE